MSLDSVDFWCSFFITFFWCFLWVGPSTVGSYLEFVHIRRECGKLLKELKTDV